MQACIRRASISSQICKPAQVLLKPTYISPFSQIRTFADHAHSHTKEEVNTNLMIIHIYLLNLLLINLLYPLNFM